jgi:hypothetical protein
MRADFRRVFRAIPPLMRAELPAELHDFRWSTTSWMAKAWYGNKEIHYEIWVRYAAKTVEIGLHFEADALTNARLYGAFRSRAPAVRRGLGDDARIEQWDKGWTRVWQPFTLQDRLDDEYATLIQTRFVDYVRVLEPILRDELPNDVEWDLTKPRPPRRAASVTSSRASRSRR